MLIGITRLDYTAIVIGMIVIGSGFFFVFQENDDTSKFIGTWRLVDSSTISTDINGWVLEFYTNGTMKETIIKYTDPINHINNYSSISWIKTYKISGEKLYIIYGNSTWWYTYEFSNQDTELELSISSYTIEKFKKE